MNKEFSISLGTTQKFLGWPTADDITHPSGAGASVFATLVREKLGRSIRSFADAKNASLGVLMPDSTADSSEPPLAIVVEFTNDVNDNTLRELHRLSWNFSHVPTLITIEPRLLRVWSCCEAPNNDRNLEEYLVHGLTAEDVTLQHKAARALHWINLVSGQFFADHPDRFDRDGRADQMLLGNLRHIRAKLFDQGLENDDVCHDLLARVIFVQFLFDRKDADGNPALTETKLLRLHGDGILHSKHNSFDSVLSDYEDTYRLFEWLNTKFNGDLFPGKGDSAIARALGWGQEKSVVNAQHLSLLAKFIRGDIDMPSGQGCLWPQYAFDVIPLEFISSIYETFVTERASRDGIFYTPPYLVDFILDRVLPWEGTKWDLKVLDPACGSGIFLVKSFQRLVYRWKTANPNEPIRADILRRMLERNIVGVDKDPHAVRVACFSLYLAMCDEIEPRHYWTQVTFPTMRERRLICSDFFSEERDGFRTEKDKNSYDLIVGNAPWGDGVITDCAIEWAAADSHKWTIPNNDVGGLFLAKAAHLANKKCEIAFIQSANSLLFNIRSTAIEFRRKFFTTYKVQQIINLSALRFKVFKRKSHTTKTSAAPACVVIMHAEKPDMDDQISYITPKHLKPLVDEFTIILEPNDYRTLSVEEAISDSLIWSTLMWGGGPRDRQLIKKLKSFDSLESLTTDHKILARQGINYGDRKKRMSHLDGKPLFDQKMFPSKSILKLDANLLPRTHDVNLDSRASINFEAFQSPQLIVKHSWNRSSGRFHARMVVSTSGEAILCSQSYQSIHAEISILETACISHNSKLAVYYHFLTSGRFAAYRPKLSKAEILQLPIPQPKLGLTDGIGTLEELDERVFSLFGLKDAERVLIEDLLLYTIPNFLGDRKSEGTKPTSISQDESHLRSYSEYFVRVLKAGFGQDKSVAATIFRSENNDLPYRLIAFELREDTDDSVKVVNMQPDRLLGEFERLSLSSQTVGGIYNKRIARIYDSSGGVPTVFMIKPDQKRFWTRSMALQDGDEVALDLFNWQQDTFEIDETKN